MLGTVDKVACMLRSKSLIYLCICAFPLAACGSEDAVTAGSAAGADGGSVGDGATLLDGWQFSQDSTPPNDSWAWNSEIAAGAVQMQQPHDAAQNLDVVGDSAATDGANAEIIGGVDANAAEVKNDEIATGGKGKVGAACASNGQCDSGFAWAPKAATVIAVWPDATTRRSAIQLKV